MPPGGWTDNSYGMSRIQRTEKICLLALMMRSQVSYQAAQVQYVYLGPKVARNAGPAFDGCCLGTHKAGCVPQLNGHTACATEQTCLERAELCRTRLISAGYALILVIGGFYHVHQDFICFAVQPLLPFYVLNCCCFQSARAADLVTKCALHLLHCQHLRPYTMPTCVRACVCVCVCVSMRVRDPHELELLINPDSARSSDLFAPSLLPSFQAHASAESCIADA